ncbi:dynamin family protein [Micromonospora sp. NBC_01699]|uniref:dynamin family protein n=1 Tax=Micromonospora sp. NBC_01699 TaxID=2975984 RepID=UPI002E34F6F8|nr:dynamin family protein [Micromonospora sp. NBC_01699]
MTPIWLDVLDETSRLCAAHGRHDLVDSVRRKRVQLLDPGLRVLVVGEPKQGKSQLVNALINAPVCPVGDGRTTVVPTVVRHAPEPTAALVRAAAPAPGRPAVEAPAAAVRLPLPIEQVTARISTTVAAGSGGTHVEIGLPRGLLAGGLTLVDTPGAEGPDQARTTNAYAALARPDAVLLVTDSTRELSVAELNLLLHLAQSHPNVIVVQTKIDMVPDWRGVVDRNRQHLASAGVPAALIPVSAALRLAAAKTDDRVVNAESRFPDLIGRLLRDQNSKAEVLARSAVALLSRTTIEQLAAPLRAELTSATSGDNSAAMNRLRAAQREVDELRRCSTRWQNTLNDEMADLLSDIEYDLRDRTRKILRQVDEAFETADPQTGWEPFQEWLEENLVEAAEANFVWLAQRCDWIAGRVAAQFTRYGQDALPDWSVQVPADIAERLPVLEQPPIERFTPTQKVVTALRGSYGGVLMFGLATSLAGMPLINFVSLGAGALFGGKSIVDESKSLLKRRQAAVRVASARHVDDFFLRLNKDCRDTARRVQRMLRDHFAALTEDLQEAIVASLRTAKQSADADAAVRDQRHRQIEQEMRRLAALYEQVQQLASGRSAAGSAPLGSPR